jgi:hypothetical protein
MWGALPLARRVLHAALMGRRPLQAARVAEPVAIDDEIYVAADGGELAPWAERARTRLTARVHER